MKTIVKIRTHRDLQVVLAKWEKRREENFIVVTLNASHEIIKIHHISKGIVNKTIVHPREVFYPAINDNAVMAAKILGFKGLDHLIIARRNCYSYRQESKFDDTFLEDCDLLKDNRFEIFADEIAAEKNRKNH